MDELQHNKKRIAVIHYDKNSYFAKLIKDYGFTVVSAYKETNLLQRAIRKIHNKLEFKKKELWFNRNHDLGDYDTLIIFDAAINSDLVKFMKELYPAIRLILWYWNPVRNSIDPNLLSADICEKWSYSLEDCKKYNLNYNSTFYFSSLIKSLDRKDWFVDKNDIFFIGRDKGRLSLLLDYKNKFESMGLKTNFHITPTRWYGKWKNKNFKNLIGYDQIIEQIKSSKCILDIVQDQSDGLTLRVMESLFFKKKLITNNKTIKTYDFYNNNNIFILGEDPFETLKEFIEIPYTELDNEIVQKYEFKEWISRF